MLKPLKKLPAEKIVKATIAFVLGCTLSFPALPGIAESAYAVDDLEAAVIADAIIKDSAAKAWDLSTDNTATSVDIASSLVPAAAGDGAITLQGSFEEVPETDESFKFILRWGEEPLDLDSHIDGYRPDGYPIHVYYSDSETDYNDETYCALDHDDIDSYGPETIKLANSSNFPCYYYIHNYSGSPAMTTSGASIEVYKGGALVSKMSIPTRGSGCYWNVGVVVDGQFKPNGANGTITESPDVNYADVTRWTGTSTSKRKYPDYDHWFKVGNLNHYMVNTRSITEYYPDFEAFLNKSYPIPGLENSVVAGSSDCDARVPQGICVTPDYILISAYCAGPKIQSLVNDGTLHTRNDMMFLQELTVHGKSGKRHDAAIYALDRMTGQYVATITLKNSANLNIKLATDDRITGDHVGGLAFDGDHVWVATSNLRSETSTGDLLECMIDYDALKAAAAQGDDGSLEFGGQEARLVPLPGDDLSSASFNTFHDGLLWVGDNKPADGKGCRLVGFKYADGELVRQQSYKIPSGGNGATFIAKGNITYLLINTSEGRNKASTVYRWNVTNLSNLSRDVYLSPWPAKYSLPPMLEEACVYDGNLYTVYESGATLYSCFSSGKGRATQNVDEVCVAPIEQFFSKRPSGANSDKGNAWWNWNKSGRARISVACPVNVYLEDDYGYTLASIVDGVVENHDDSQVYVWLNGDEKNFLVPNDGSFRLRMSAYDDGEMDVSITEYDENGEMATASYRNNVSLDDGEQFSGALKPLSGDEDEGATGASDAFTLQSITKLDVGDPEAEIVETDSVNDPSSLTSVALEVVSEGPGIAVGAGEVVRGDYASLFATPEDGAKFIGWYQGDECVSTAADLVVKVDAATAYTAKFKDVDYAIDHVKVEGDGYVTADSYGLGAEYGEEIEVKAVANDLSLFEGWYLEDELVSTSSWYWFNAQSEDGITARFKPTPAAHVVVTAEGPGFAEVVSSDEKVGGEAEVKAVPDDDCVFKGWYIDGNRVSTSSSYWFDLTGDITLVAKFDLKRSANVMVKAEGPGRAEVDYSDGYIGGWAAVYAAPDADAAFEGFYIGSKLVEDDDYYSFEITGDMTIVAKFKKMTTVTTQTPAVKKVNPPKPNPLKAKAKTVNIKLKKLKKKAQLVTAKNAFKVTGAQGKVTYKVSTYDKKAKKKITVAKNGKVTVKKGLKKGVYKLKVKVSAAGNAAYKKAAKTVTLKVKVA